MMSWRHRIAWWLIRLAWRIDDADKFEPTRDEFGRDDDDVYGVPGGLG